MIDVNKITSTLAKLPDQQLQQYAQMHKSDPYIMALAMSESNRRKEMRSAGQGAQGMQEQPKVVDQMLAEMAPQQMPEDQGIGQLPAGEMNFAGGGIIAFADGGGVERYQSQGLVQPRARWEEELERLQAPPQESSALGRGIVNAFTYSSDFEALVQSAKAKQASGIPLTAPEARVLQATAPTTPSASPAPAANLSGMDRRLMSGSQPSIASLKTPLPTKAAPTADTTRRGAPGAGLGAAAAAGAGSTPSNQFDVSAMMRAELDKQRATPDPLEADRAALAADRKALAESNVSGLEAIQKNFDNIFSGRKARMDTREGEIGKMKDQTLGLALLNAGATMMSTRGNLGTAIGAGIGVGSKQYVDGMGRIEAAKEKLSTARDRLEELEAQRGELSARELFKANQDVKQVGISVKDDMIKARMAFNNESYAKAEKAVTAQLNANLEVYKQQQANLRNKETASAYSAGTRQDQVSISALKAQADVINKQLEAMGPPLKSTAAKRKPLEDELARITSQLAQMSGLSTMTPPPGAGSAGGARPPIDSFQR
jgi:hypothetical protein